LRSAAGTLVTDELGIDRVKGPLGSAATIHVAFLPAFTTLLGEALQKRQGRKLTAILAGSVGVAIVLTGSRTALACLVLSVLLVLLKVKRPASRWLSIGLLVLIILVSVESTTSMTRFTKLNDPARAISYATSWRLATHDVGSALWGRGYGTVWAWYPRQIVLSRLPIGSEMWVFTPEGPVLYHPHSVFWAVLVELGLLGTVLLAWSLYPPIREFLGKPADLSAYALAGVVAAMPSFLTDLYLLNNWEVSLVWWAFVFLAARPSPRTDSRGLEDPNVPAGA
jgi:O-antigen ligase